MFLLLCCVCHPAPIEFVRDMFLLDLIVMFRIVAVVTFGVLHVVSSCKYRAVICFYVCMVASSVVSCHIWACGRLSAPNDFCLFLLCSVCCLAICRVFLFV